MDASQTPAQEDAIRVRPPPHFKKIVSYFSVAVLLGANAVMVVNNSSNQIAAASAIKSLRDQFSHKLQLRGIPEDDFDKFSGALDSDPALLADSNTFNQELGRLSRQFVEESNAAANRAVGKLAFFATFRKQATITRIRDICPGVVLTAFFFVMGLSEYKKEQKTKNVIRHKAAPAQITSEGDSPIPQLRDVKGRFRVTGIELSSGRSVELVSKAPTVELAQKFAEAMGLDPKSVIVAELKSG